MSSDSQDQEAPTKGSVPLPSAALAWQALENRASLAWLEVAEMRTSAVRLSLGAIAALLMAQLIGGSLLAVVTALSWDTEYRVIAPAAFTATLILMTLALLIWWRVQAKAWKPFGSTREQLGKDRKLIRAMMGKEAKPETRNDREQA